MTTMRIGPQTFMGSLIGDDTREAQFGGPVTLNPDLDSDWTGLKINSGTSQALNLIDADSQFYVEPDYDVVTSGRFFSKSANLTGISANTANITTMCNRTACWTNTQPSTSMTNESYVTKANYSYVTYNSSQWITNRTNINASIINAQSVRSSDGVYAVTSVGSGGNMYISNNAGATIRLINPGTSGEFQSTYKVQSGLHRVGVQLSDTVTWIWYFQYGASNTHSYNMSGTGNFTAYGNIVSNKSISAVDNMTAKNIFGNTRGTYANVTGLSANTANITTLCNATGCWANTQPNGITLNATGWLNAPYINSTRIHVSNITISQEKDVEMTSFDVLRFGDDQMAGNWGSQPLRVFWNNTYFGPLGYANGALRFDNGFNGNTNLIPIAANVYSDILKSNTANFTVLSANLANITNYTTSGVYGITKNIVIANSSTTTCTMNITSGLVTGTTCSAG